MVREAALCHHLSVHGKAASLSSVAMVAQNGRAPRLWIRPRGMAVLSARQSQPKRLALMMEIVEAVKQAVPDASNRPTGEVLEYASPQIAMRRRNSFLADAQPVPANGHGWNEPSIPAFITVKGGVVACYRARTVVRGIPSTFCVKA